jgi:hypothetical protein
MCNLLILWITCMTLCLWAISSRRFEDSSFLYLRGEYSSKSFPKLGSRNVRWRYQTSRRRRFLAKLILYHYSVYWKFTKRSLKSFASSVKKEHGNRKILALLCLVFHTRSLECSWSDSLRNLG